MTEHTGRGDEDDVEAAATRFVPERLGEMRFADAGGPLDQEEDENPCPDEEPRLLNVPRAY